MSGGVVAVITGYVSREPDLRYSPTGTAYLKFSIPVEQGEKREGQWISDAAWWNFTVFGKWAETLMDVNRPLAKGDLIRVTAKQVKITVWTPRDGGDSKANINCVPMDITKLKRSGNGGETSPEQEAAPEEGGAME